MNARVLILTSSSGGAHTTIAHAIDSALQERGIADSRIFDLHDLFSPLARWYFARGQFVFLNTLNRPMSALIRPLQQTRHLANLTQRFYPFRLRELHVVCQELRPTVVVATHALGVAVARRVVRRVPVIAIPVNYEAHRFLIHPAVATYCAPHATVVDDFIAMGIMPQQVVVTGMPVPAAFEHLPSPQAARQQLNLPGNAPVVMVSQGLTGSGPHTVTLVRTLLKMLPPVTHVLVMVGHNTILQKLLLKLDLPQRVHIVPFVTNFAVYVRAADICIGKAGGASSTSVFLSKTALIVLSPNAFEVKSADRFATAGAALLAHGSISRAAALAQQLVTDPAARQRVINAADQFVIPRARHAVAELVARAGGDHL